MSEDWEADYNRIKAYWTAHPAKLAGRTIGVLTGQRIENEAALKAIEPHVMRTWPNCARRTINELRQITGYDYNDTKPPRETPYLTKEQIRRRTLDGFAKQLREAGWTVTPPE